MKALVIDDEEEVRQFLQLSLDTIGGMTVIEASNGEEGVERARSDRPDFILLDMMMPGMDGAATFLALRASAETSEIPVVFLTSKLLAPDGRRLEDLGAEGVLRKPFDPMTLARDIRTILTS